MDITSAIMAILIGVGIVGIIYLFGMFLSSSNETNKDNNSKEDNKNNTINVYSDEYQKALKEKMLKEKERAEKEQEIFEKFEKIIYNIIKCLLGIVFSILIIVIIFSDGGNSGGQIMSSVTCRTMLQQGANMGYGNSSVSFPKNETKDFGYFLVKTPNAFGGKEENCVKCYYSDRGGADNIEFVSRDNCNQKW